MQAQPRCLAMGYKSSELGWPSSVPETLFSRALQAIASFQYRPLQRQEVSWDPGVTMQRDWPAQQLGLQVVPHHFPVHTCF